MLENSLQRNFHDLDNDYTTNSPVKYGLSVGCFQNRGKENRHDQRNIQRGHAPIKDGGMLEGIYKVLQKE